MFVSDMGFDEFEVVSCELVVCFEVGIIVIKGVDLLE